MISDIVMTGIVAEKKGMYRFLTSESKKNCYSEDDMVISKIPLLYWTRDDNNALNKLKKGIHVAIRGRIEHNNSCGLYVLVESFDTIK